VDWPCESRFDSLEGLCPVGRLDGKVLAAGGKISVRFNNDAKSAWDFNLVDDEELSVTFEKVKLAGVDTVTLKNVNGTMTAEIE